MKAQFCRTCQAAGRPRLAFSGGAAQGHDHGHQGGRFRLPLNVVPRHYDLTISPDPASRTFTGQVTIDVDVVEATDCIKVNVKDLTIECAAVAHADGTTLCGEVSYDVEAETAVIAFAGRLGVGFWQLSLDFSGRHGDNGQGFFASTWKDAADVEHTVLCTQFESADARAAFPCFDEPHFKATFKSRLIVDQALTALGNGDIVSVSATEGAEGKKTVEFEKTGLMSTYVVAFVVGPFVGSEPFYVNGKRLQIWCMPGEEDETRFGRGVAAFGLDYMERYFGIPYPFGKKIDLVSVPGFAWGGMENVGLIVFQKSLLLCPDDAPDHVKYNVAEIINHELAHQWFGDLVTMRWWNGLWLNESFATFMQYKVTDAWRPQAKRWEHFAPARSLAYWTDSLRASHPIEQSVERGGDAILLVDAISYQKGCSVLYQIEQFLGEEVVRRGISLYLKEHSFGNTESGDLWDGLEAACREADETLRDFPVRALMDSWIFQSGHPEVLVSEVKPGVFELTQRPFLLLERGRKAKKTWPIPMHLEYRPNVGAGTGVNDDVVRRKIVFSGRKMRLALGDCRWLKLNAGGSGFYRVHYSTDLLGRLIDARNADALTGLERYNILADARAFFNARTIDSGAYVDLLLSFVAQNSEKNEKAQVAWSVLMKCFAHLAAMCDERELRRLTRLVASHLRRRGEAAGWLRDGKLVASMVPFGEELLPYHININWLVQRNSRPIYRSWRKDRGSVSELVASQASMVLAYARARVVKEFDALGRGGRMAGGEDILEYLNAVVAANAAEGRKVDICELLSSLIVYPGWGSGGNVQRVLDSWPEMVQSKSTPPIQLLYRVRYGLETVDDSEHEAQLKALFRKHPSRLAAGEIRLAMERIAANVAMRRHQMRSLRSYLRRRAALT